MSRIEAQIIPPRMSAREGRRRFRRRARRYRPGVPYRMILAPGASGTVAGLRPYLKGLAAKGLEARGLELPRGSVERALPVYRSALRAGEPASTIIGGHSFGGRVASLLAAEEHVAGLLLMSYPLHRPGHPEQWEVRTDHWPRIGCPVLLLSGESDPFARVGLLRDAVRRLPHGELVTYPGVRHGIGPVLPDALERIAAWVARVQEAGTA
jgi:predicted alpha/beta-hydrolase family hydrolase